MEAFVAFHQASIDVATRRHEEIMSSLDRPASSDAGLPTPEAASITEKMQVIAWPENTKSLAEMMSWRCFQKLYRPPRVANSSSLA